MTKGQRFKLKDILKYDLKSVRAYLLKEAFQIFWEYKSPYWAGQYLDKWITRAMRSRFGIPVTLEVESSEGPDIGYLQNDTAGDAPGSWAVYNDGWYFVDEDEEVIIDSFSVTNPPTDDITGTELRVQYGKIDLSPFS